MTDVSLTDGKEPATTDAGSAGSIHRDPVPNGHATLRRSATIAGSSGVGSLPHNFHQGRGAGSTGGWKFQIASARRIRCSKNCASFALARWAMLVSRSYGSRPQNKTHGLPPQWRSGAFVFRLNCGRVLLSATLIADLTLTHHLLVVSRCHQLRRLVNLAP